jgi:hypothetical protein
MTAGRLEKYEGFAVILYNINTIKDVERSEFLSNIV